MKICLKTGETLRVKTDGDVPLMIWIGKDGEAQLTAQPAGQPTRVVIEDRRAKIEVA